ncbi:AMP-binding protein [Bradyrhizobium betae]|uniref:ATP-dependent acyl-CoA ligase n=1 Tax=Bradyrhizobium betae TaxID=244734 RepID=A0A4Q1UGI3_9BRAD|nr:AMP-binding protein [Bradyrhizobium betae]RXT33323.1 ATP-dependent acyl-CoA ligase [Bradyrhizobium betae]
MSGDNDRLSPSDRYVLRNLVDRYARERGHKTFVVLSTGEEWSYTRLRDNVRRVAANLQALGVKQDDFVLSWLPNGPHSIAVWFALNYIGAVYVPVNVSYRGRLLAHVIRNSGARLMIADARLAERLGEVETAALDTLVTVAGEPPQGLSGIRGLTEDALSSATSEPADPAREIMPWDTHAVIYTSGTTGPSKGVLSSYRHLAATTEAIDTVTSDDRAMVNLPLFHVGGTSGVYRMLVRGGSIALVESFDTQTFWDTVRRTGATTTTLLGAMIPFLMKAPPSPRDRDHTFRQAIMVPLADDAAEFTARFGVDIYTVFNMTEISCPIVSVCNPDVPKTCGRIRAGFEARVVDANNVEVPHGTVGELMVRADEPWTMNHGYNANPEATARAWRNGWFHTGDAFRRDDAGNFFFVDRIKDAIRRRGENISSFEVEAEIGAHPKVRESAVVGVPSEFGEDEVMAVVSPVPGADIDPLEIISFLTPRLPHFMVPRYVRLLAELPKTPTQKIEKHVLRSEGVTGDTWDRERAGIRLKREKLTAGDLKVTR